MREHLLAVADRARDFAEGFGGGELAYTAGLLHDLGKYTPEFQKYLRDCHLADQKLGPRPQPGSAPHKQHGAAYAAHRVASILAFIILGHHGQIPDRAETKDEAAKLPLGEIQPLFEVALADCPELASLPDPVPHLKRMASNAVELELLARMVYSCLVDADSLDTERHFNPDTAAARTRPTPNMAALRDLFTQDQRSLLESAEATPVNEIRRRVYDACVAAGSRPTGVYRLTVPTGGGKTRSSLAFALEHACRHGLRRIIYAIPYTSIIDQAGEVFEGIFGADAVLEHHSAIEPPEENAEEAVLEREVWRRLASQNWDAPLILTTTVQLFESLFGNRPARSRKVHRLTRAVIVLDEVQTLPPKLLRPLVDGLRLLAERYGSTVLLCTATQPALDQQTLAQVGFAGIQEVAPDPPRLFADLRRVTYDLAPLAERDGWTWEQAAAQMRAHSACLAVVNTRRDALALLDALNEEQALHLSTLLCGRHRREVLAEIRRRLKAGGPCRVVSTQVVECGCDLDFPLVLRALGPLDRIVQAGGRCNREGQRDADESRVVVFRPAAGGAPRGSYQVAIGVAARLLRGGADLHDPEVYQRYFREAYAADDTDARRIQKLRGELDYPGVAEQMRLIDDDTVGVLVVYPRAEAEVEGLLGEVRSRGRMDRPLWRRVQPFLVSLARRDFERLRSRSLIAEEVPDLWRWWGGYDLVRGITEVECDPADLIV